MDSEEKDPQSSVGDSDSREHERKAIELKVEYKRLNAFFADYTRNISNGGTFITTDKPLGIGTQFVFKLQVPKLSEPLRICGLVKWIVEESEEEEPGMGIQFVYNEPAEKEAVESIVEGLMVDSLGRFLTAKLMAQGKEAHAAEVAARTQREAEK